MRPHIAIFFTGGTISMRVDPESGGAVPALSGKQIIAQVPGLDQIVDFDVIDFACLPGPQMTPPKMLELSKALKPSLNDQSVTGAVIKHGTDTLEETAYLLDLLLNEEKP